MGSPGGLRDSRHSAEPSDYGNIRATAVTEGRIINIDPEILGGTPVFHSTRVPIKNLFDYLKSGETIDFFLNDFGGITREQVVSFVAMLQKLMETTSHFLHEFIV